MKYVIGQCKETGFFYPIVFDDNIVHCDAAKALPKNCRLFGAGYCTPRREPVEAWGESVSLKIGATKDDAVILAFFLKTGVSGLQLNNQLAFLEIAAGENLQPS
jgi:hypothetical protein